ncbi:uncharacterized protein [Littorina saxatilis]|uniref:uncharacterized protein n=1 Tax=Littorina saxatilis TaxID=31220 RepID=UPI0038B609E5
MSDRQNLCADSRHCSHLSSSCPQRQLQALEANVGRATTTDSRANNACVCISDSAATKKAKSKAKAPKAKVKKKSQSSDQSAPPLPYQYAFTSRKYEFDPNFYDYYEVSLAQFDVEALTEAYSSSSSSSSSSIGTSSTAVNYDKRGRPWRKMRRKGGRSHKDRSSSGNGTELLVFTFFLVVMMLTLSQVLVVHHKYTGHYGQTARPRSARIKAQQDLRMIDRSIAALRRQHVLSPKQDAESMQKQVYAHRIARMIRKANEESKTLLLRMVRLQQAQGNLTLSSNSNTSSPFSSSSLLSLPSSEWNASSSSLLSLLLLPSDKASELLSSKSSSALSSKTGDSFMLSALDSWKRNSSSSIASSSTTYSVSKNKSSRHPGGGGVVGVVDAGAGGGGAFLVGDGINATDGEGRLRLGNVTGTEVPMMKLCPAEPPGLIGNVSADINAEHKTLAFAQVMDWNTDLNPGGEWSPKDCVARYRLAIVIPYRDRLAHLTVLLAHLLPILKRQQLHFRIFVVEQVR